MTDSITILDIFTYFCELTAFSHVSHICIILDLHFHRDRVSLYQKQLIFEVIRSKGPFTELLFVSFFNVSVWIEKQFQPSYKTLLLQCTRTDSNTAGLQEKLPTISFLRQFTRHGILINKRTCSFLRSHLSSASWRL